MEESLSCFQATLSVRVKRSSFQMPARFSRAIFYSLLTMEVKVQAPENFSGWYSPVYVLSHQAKGTFLVSPIKKLSKAFET